MVDPLFQSVFPILFFDEKKINLAGTSILVEINDDPMLLTAAHVLRDPGGKYNLYLLLQENAVKLPSPALMSKLPNDDNTADLDIAFFPLSIHHELMEYLEGFKTITLKEFDEQIEYVRENYFIFGYPWRKTKYFDKKLKIKPLRYFTDLITDQSTYELYNILPEDHLIVRYRQKATINRKGIKTNAPMPHGISGGPLFRSLIDKDNNVIMLILEGLLTEWKDKKYIVATRKRKVRCFIEAIITCI